MEKDDVTLRFSHWAGPVGAESVFFSELIFRATGRKTRIVNDQSKKVDIEIESVYGATNSNTLVTRARRFVSSHLPGGIDFANPDNSPNQQPSGNARFNIFFTGENERPPQGRWDAYLSFDLNSYKNRNEYLPLWWITSSNILVPTVSPYLGRPITIEQMLKERSTNYQSRKKFCVAFIGKAYPFRMHSIAALSDIDKVDVFGAIARNTKQTSALEKFEIAQDYRFVYSFENDYYPGYVTEKLPEAWATGGVPLYWGSDVTKTMNPASFINAGDYESLEKFVEHVSVVNASEELWSSIAKQPLLLSPPNIEKVISMLSRILAPLREDNL